MSKQWISHNWISKYWLQSLFIIRYSALIGAANRFEIVLHPLHTWFGSTTSPGILRDRYTCLESTSTKEAFVDRNTHFSSSTAYLAGRRGLKAAGDTGRLKSHKNDQRDIVIFNYVPSWPLCVKDEFMRRDLRLIALLLFFFFKFYYRTPGDEITKLVRHEENDAKTYL
jgi:hypothetical protein